jgi:Clp amino terminal domain, pathogenicity island component
MTAYPIPLDNLITFVKAQHPDGDELEFLSAAVVVGATLNDESDALIGHFVDQARRAGASWSQIGASMGVTKQAAQKRFVPKWDGSDLVPEGQLFSRFTLRTRDAIMAGSAAAPGGRVGAAHIVAGLLTQPEGLAARIVRAAGVEDATLLAALGVDAATAQSGGTAAALRAVDYDDSAKALLQGTLRAVLRLGHNYVGTEHLLLGALVADGDAARALESVGLTADVVERGVAEEIARIQAERGR